MTTIRDWEGSLARARKAGDRKLEATCLGSLANEYAWAGNISKGVDCSLQAIAIRKDLGDWRGMALSCKNLAAIYEVGLGDLASAVHWLEQAVAYDPTDERYASMLAGARERLRTGGQ